MTPIRLFQMVSSPLRLQRVSLHLTQCLETKTAGRYKTTINKDFPLTYEMANKPDMIGVRKAQNSMNTSVLLTGLRKAETAQEDLFIRKFMHGTWPQLLLSDVIIKRRANQIVLNFVALRAIAPSKMYFLIGYTEEILSYCLKCIVKIELQTVENQEDIIYKYI